MLSVCGAKAGCNVCQWVDRCREVLTGYSAADPGGPVPSSVTVSPRQICGSDLEARGFVAHLESPNLPVFRTSQVADFVLSETLHFVQVGENTFKSSFPEKNEKKKIHTGICPTSLIVFY